MLSRGHRFYCPGLGPGSLVRSDPRESSPPVLKLLCLAASGKWSVYLRPLFLRTPQSVPKHHSRCYLNPPMHSQMRGVWGHCLGYPKTPGPRGRPLDGCCSPASWSLLTVGVTLWQADLQLLPDPTDRWGRTPQADLQLLPEAAGSVADTAPPSRPWSCPGCPALLWGPPASASWGQWSGSHSSRKVACCLPPCPLGMSPCPGIGSWWPLRVLGPRAWPVPVRCHCWSPAVVCWSAGPGRPSPDAASLVRETGYASDRGELLHTG